MNHSGGLTRMGSRFFPRLRAGRKIPVRMAVAGAIVVASIAVPAAAYASPPPSPTAQPQVGADVPVPPARTWTWIVADADTGAVLGGRDWHWPLPSASTMKTLTALSLVNRLDMNSTYIARPVDTNAEGSRVGLKVGSPYTVRDLFNGMLMPSGNDAATALASAYGGMERTTAVMNEEAQRLGAQQTVAKNSTGLDEPGQTTSAYDLALIFRESLKNPTLREIYAQHHVDFPDAQPTDGSARHTYRIWTENRLILNYYPGAIGGKTGFTSQAGRTYVGAVQRDGHTLIVAIMRSAERTETLAERLLTWGFDNYDKLKPVDQLADPQPEPQVQAVAAATYDSNGKAHIDQASEQSTQSSGPQTIQWFVILLGLVAVAILVLRRRHSSRSEKPVDQYSDIDVREHDEPFVRR